MSELRKTVEEWIIDPKVVDIQQVIATGSTCQVYKGVYKNNFVAVKKINGIKNAQKMKFLKEFKREASLLVSIPS